MATARSFQLVLRLVIIKKLLVYEYSYLKIFKTIKEILL
jgi:hypothetical protein